MAGKPKFLFGGEGGTYEDFEKKLLSEISKGGLTTEFKKKSFLYKHLTGTVLDTLTKLLFPIKISDKSFEELLVSLKTHYIPNKHLRERVSLYARIQEEDEQTKDYFETLKVVASRCQYNAAELKLVLCDKVLTGIRCPRLRESLFVAGISPSCTPDQYMEYALLYEINVNNEKLALQKNVNQKNKKLNINKNIDRSPSPDDKKPISDSPAAKFGVSLKKGNENNNINRNGNKGPVVWKPKIPLTPQSTFGVTLKSKSTSQVSPKSSSAPNTPISNGMQDDINGLPSPKPMTIPEIMEFVKDPRKPSCTPDKNKIIGNKGIVAKSVQQREPSWSPSPSPEPRRFVAFTPESKNVDKNNQNRKTKSPLQRESSWSPTPSPSPEPREIRSQDTRGRSFSKDQAPKMKRSSSTLSIRDKPSITGLSNKDAKTPAAKLKRSSSSVSLSRNPIPEMQESFDPMRSLRQGLAALKSVKHLKQEPETISKKERFDISDKLPKLRSVGGYRRSPTEIVDMMPDILEITDIEPRKPTITPEARKILDKYLNRAPPKMDTTKIQPRRERSYSPSPEPEPKPDLTKKSLINKCAKPSTSLPNKSMSYSDLTKSDLFENFLQAKNTQTSAQKSQKPFKINKVAKKDEVPQLTDEVRRKLEEKYGIIKAKPREPIIEESLEPEIDKSHIRTHQSRDMFEGKTNVSIFGVVQPSDRVVQMYKESQQEKESLKEANFPEKSNVITPTTPTQKPLSTIKASPKIAEMYKAQIMERDKDKCPSPPTEKSSSAITRFADKKWVSTLDLSSSRKEYDADSFRTTLKPLIWSPSVSPEPHDNKGPLKNEILKPSISREPSWSPSISPEPQDEIPEIPEKIEPRKSCITSDTKRILDKYCNKDKENTNPSIKREPSRSLSVSPEPQEEIPEIPEKIVPRKSCITSETKTILDKYCNKEKENTNPSIKREPSRSPSVSPEPQDEIPEIPEKIEPRKSCITSETKTILDKYCNKEKEAPKSSIKREPSWSPSVSPEPIDNREQLKKEYPKPSIRREPSRSPSVSPKPKDNIDHLKKVSPKPSITREPSWSPSVSPDPKDNRGQLKKESPKQSVRRESSLSPSVSPEPKDNKDQVNNETTKPSVRRESSWSPSVTPEPKDNIGQLKKESPNHSVRRESSWSPSPSPGPQDNRSESNKETPKVPDTRNSSWSPSPSPEPQNRKSQLKEASPKSIVRRDPSWSPSPSPEPRDTRCQDSRGRSSAREESLQLKRSSSNVNAREMPSTNTMATASTLKRSCSSLSISRTSRVLNEIPEIPIPEIPEAIDMDFQTKRIIDTYCNKAQNKKDSPKSTTCNKAKSIKVSPKLIPEREPSYSPSPEPEPGPDLTREQLFDKYAKLSTTYQAKSSSYLDLTKSDVFDQFLQARDSPTPSSKVKKQIMVNKKSKKEEVKELTDDDRRKLEEKYGIIRGKPKEPNPEGEDSPQTKRKRSPSRAQQSRILFQEKEKALQTGVAKDTDKDEQKNDSLPSNPEIPDKIEPRKSCISSETKTIVDKYCNIEKPNIVIKSSSNIAEKYKAELEKQNLKNSQSPLTEKAALIIARSSEKRSSLDLTPLELSRMKKEYDAESLKKDALKFNIKECKYNAEVDYGDSLLKVSEKDAFNVRKIKTEFFQQDRADSPVTAVIPPKPGSAAAAKPQFDISSFFDGSSYSNFLESAKSTKGGTK